MSRSLAPADDSLPETCGDAVDWMAARLVTRGVETARLDARLLVAAALSIDPGRVFSHPEGRVDTDAATRLLSYLHRRESREPVARIVGEKGFWSMPFALGEATLVPRPETETVVEAVVDLAGDRRRSMRVLDLGTGSGCLLLAVLAELPEAEGIGTDIDAGALDTARRNAERNDFGRRTQFLRADWCDGLAGATGGGFDWIVSNPPYVVDAEIDGLEPEVARYEPRQALSGGADGLDAYRRILAGVSRLLAEHGRVALEVGIRQAGPVALLAQERGFDLAAVRCDLAGIERVVVLRRADRGSVKKTVGMTDVPD